MSKNELLIRLRELHEELESINEDLQGDEPVDDQTIDQLGEMVSEMSEIVDLSRVGSQHSSVSRKHCELLNRIQEFDNGHPRVIHFLSQLAHLLAMTARLVSD